jgi:hypothetical protein
MNIKEIILLSLFLFFFILHQLIGYYLYKKIYSLGYKPPHPFLDLDGSSKFYSFIKKNVKEKKEFPINFLIIIVFYVPFIYIGLAVFYIFLGYL